MVINAVVISHSDPGAVPGASTTLRCALRLPYGEPAARRGNIEGAK